MIVKLRENLVFVGLCLIIRQFFIKGSQETLQQIFLSYYKRMNPLTQVRNQQKVTEKELGRSAVSAASWHQVYKDSHYIFTGGLDYELTEGDLLAIFSQYGEVAELKLVRDKDTGKSKGFAFLGYEDQRSTTLAVDNFNGAKICGRIIRVEHMASFRRGGKKDGEDVKAPAPLPKSEADLKEQHKRQQELQERQMMGLNVGLGSLLSDAIHDDRKRKRELQRKQKEEEKKNKIQSAKNLPEPKEEEQKSKKHMSWEAGLKDERKKKRKKKREKERKRERDARNHSDTD
eukprot:TRINITY_DN13666_c0_g1_i1.p1 TRINITY_DN13666_c0_g1~~TRINITY_DN13666_c0_g1_i1.p1  ORF type:complete len:288 (-),score=35.00 TRINITY_DN13666_c0_g1_i1:410-1273(-)